MMAIKSFKSLSVSLVTILIYSSTVSSEDVTNPEEPPKRPDSLVHHVACKDDLLALAHGYVIILHLNSNEIMFRENRLCFLIKTSGRDKFTGIK